MSQTLKILGIILFSLTSINSFSGDDKGNGGNALVCYSDDGEKSSVEFLDFYEARTFRFIHANLYTPDGTFYSKVNLVIKRIQRLSPELALYFKNLANLFLPDALFLRDIQLISSEDSFHLGLPDNKICKVEQVVHQQFPEYPEDYRYIIDLDLWELLPIDDRVGLVFHEITYNQLLHLNSSKDIRYFTSIITSDKINNFDLRDFIGLLRKVGFSEFPYNNQRINLRKPITFKYDEELKKLKIKTATLIDDAAYIH